MNLSEYVAKIETAMVDSKAALEEKGILLERVPVLSDLPALIEAIDTGVVPETYGVGTPRSIKEHVAVIESTLPLIAEKLNNAGVFTENLRISEIPEKIRAISAAKCGTAFDFWQNSFPDKIIFKNEAPPDGVETYDWSEKKDGSVIQWVDEENTLHVSAKDLSKKMLLPKDTSYMFFQGNDHPLLNEGNWTTTRVEFHDVGFVPGASTSGLLRGLNAPFLELDFSGLDTKNVTSMAYMFANMDNLSEVDVSTLDTSNVTDMRGMFDMAYVLNTIDVTNFDTRKVTNMSSMFSGCWSLDGLDLSNWDTSNVTSMAGMFNGVGMDNIDLSVLNTNSLEDISGMFTYGHKKTPLTIDFDTSNVTDMAYLFDQFDGTVDVSNLDTHSVTNMSRMFYGLNQETIDVSNLDTSHVTDMGSMFYMSKLTSLDLTNFNISEVTDTSSMFERCEALTSITANEWANAHKEELTSGKMFNDCPLLPGYVENQETSIDDAKWVENGGKFTKPADTT